MFKTKLKSLICVGALAVVGLNNTSRADVIYDSYGNYNGNAFSLGNGQEIGNQITLTTAPGTAWSLTNFSIEYYSPSLALSPDVGINIRFYLNDGPLTNGFPSPGSLFYESGWYYNTLGGGLLANGFHVVNYDSSDLYSGSLLNLASDFLLPGDFTFTVSFTNLDSENVIQLPLATSQSGISYGDYWVNANDYWTLLANGTSDGNLVVHLGGTITAVPEPASFALVAIGGAMLLGMKRLRRKP